MAILRLPLKASLLALGLLVSSGVACAQEAPSLLSKPTKPATPSPKLAGMFELELRLPEGRGLAKLLLQAGVSKDDAAVAARLAAGHLGDGLGGCEARVTISRSVEGGLRLERVMLLTQASQTIIERRQGELTLATTDSARNWSRLV
jgi:hypothetical protein